MRTGAVVSVAAFALLAGGCSVLSPVTPAVVPTFPAPATTSTPSSAPSDDSKPVLPTDCKDLIDGAQLDKALQLPLSKVVKTVVGQPSSSVGQTARLDCSYGIPSPQHTYALALSLTSYTDPAAAAARVPVNVEALRRPGVDPIPVQVGRTNGMYLALRDGPMLIASSGIYSVTVTLGPTSFTPEAAIASAAGVADMAMSNVRA